jgi:uncharacterized membrane protein
MRARTFCQYGAVISLLALIALGLLWELALAPLRPGGSWWALKVLPLLIPLRGLLYGRRYTFQWSTLLVQAYLVEGLVRSVSGQGAERWLAATQSVLALALFAALLCYARLTACREKAAACDAAAPARHSPDAP